MLGWNCRWYHTWQSDCFLLLLVIEMVVFRLPVPTTYIVWILWTVSPSINYIGGLDVVLLEWKGLSRKGICLKQTSSTSIRVELSFHSATSAGQMEELLHHLVFSKNIQPIVGGYFPYCRLSCRYLYCKLCAVGIDKISHPFILDFPPPNGVEPSY